ncbi:MAG: murein L,D-transpeptidase, partial [Clostridiales bacterium]|nr:murein L,D-transpeptidase [Clostridiales bacterium]
IAPAIGGDDMSPSPARDEEPEASISPAGGGEADTPLPPAEDVAGAPLASADGGDGGFPLTDGERGDAVRALQARLRELGFMNDAADGLFGPRTAQAVDALRQYLAGLEATQAASPPSPAATAPTPALTPAPTPAPQVDEALYGRVMGAFEVYRAEVRPGSRGPEVRRIQTRLNALSYLYAGIDGAYGPGTAAALAAFQKRGELPATGVADEATQRALFSADAPASDRPALPYVLKVSLADQKVYAYGWSAEDGDYADLVRVMACAAEPAVAPGAFTSAGPVARWGYFPEWDVYAQYLSRVADQVMFHSTLYRDADERAPLRDPSGQPEARALRGNIQLQVKDARWIWANCPAGTPVTVY